MFKSLQSNNFSKFKTNLMQGSADNISTRSPKGLLEKSGRVGDGDGEGASRNCVVAKAQFHNRISVNSQNVILLGFMLNKATHSLGIARNCFVTIYKYKKCTNK
jgi:hypothetical protein